MEKIKFKIFTALINNYGAVQILKNEVNAFLDSHEIIEISSNMNSERYESWFACELTHMVIITVKYKEEEKENENIDITG